MFFLYKYLKLSHNINGDNMQKSIWTENINEKSLPSLNEDMDCDVLIIGGGIAGISTAYKLKDENYNIVLIDKDKVGFGVSSKTTGKLTYMQGDIYTKISKIYDFKTAKKYLESQIDAIKIATNIINENKIDCDFEEVDSYIFTNNSNLDKEKEFLEKLKIYNNTNKLPLNFPNEKAFYVKNTAVFHPLKYILNLKKIILEKGVKIYENTKAIDLDIKGNKYLIKTEKGEIRATKVIITTHYPFFVIPGLIPFKIHQNRSYVVVSEEENKHFSAINIDTPSLSIRYHKDYILLGGYSHHLSKKLDYEVEEDKLINFHDKYFKNKIIYKWQVHDNMTTDYIPLIGKLNKNHPNLLIATGFNKWGMTNGVLTGEILGDLVLNKNNKYIDLFSPSRNTNLNKIINSLVNNFYIAKTYISNKLLTPKMKEAFITTINGTKCGVYVDKEGKKHIVKNICPHLKCNLVFNRADLTWDCPCHGSRFDIDGNLLEGPSVFNVKCPKKM